MCRSSLSWSLGPASQADGRSGPLPYQVVSDNRRFWASTTLCDLFVPNLSPGAIVVCATSADLLALSVNVRQRLYAARGIVAQLVAHLISLASVLR
jgi:hypothetical protein